MSANAHEAIQQGKQLIQAKHYAKAIRHLKESIPQFPEQYELKYLYLHVSNIYLSNYLTEPDIFYKIFASLPHFAHFDSKDFRHPHLKPKINETCQLILEVKIKKRRYLVKQLITPFTQWLDTAEFLKIQHTEELTQLSAIRLCLREFLHLSPFQDCGPWITKLGLDWIDPSDLQYASTKTSKQVVPLVCHCLNKTVTYLESEVQRLSSSGECAEANQRKEELGQVFLSLENKLLTYLQQNPIEQFEHQLLTVRHHLLSIIPEHYSAEDYQQINEQLLEQFKAELQSKIIEKVNLTNIKTFHKILTCLIRAQAHELVIGGYCYRMFHSDDFYPLSYTNLLEYVKVCLACQQYDLAKFEIEYTLINEPLPDDENEALCNYQKTLKSWQGADWYQATSLQDVTLKKIQKAHAFIEYLKNAVDTKINET